MRSTFRKENGITLATLVLTIIVLIIIASVSINYSLDTIDHSHYMTIVSEMQVIQEKVNLYYSEGKGFLETNLNDEHKAILQNKGVDSSEYSNYYYFTAETLSSIFDLDNLQGQYLVSVQNRDVIGLITVKNQGQSYVNYRLEDISNEFNVEYSE